MALTNFSHPVLARSLEWINGSVGKDDRGVWESPAFNQLLPQGSLWSWRAEVAFSRSLWRRVRAGEQEERQNGEDRELVMGVGTTPQPPAVQKQNQNYEI